MSAPANAFAGQLQRPTNKELASALGAKKKLWDELVGALKREHGMDEEWNSYSAKAGWSLRLKRAERNIVYLSPGTGAFRASFALGDKAVEAALKSALPAKMIETIRGAHRYAEGTAVRVEVASPVDVRTVKALVMIKLAH
ncbi:MAG: DUF3788 family protein [Terriglobales bacterium]